MTDEHSGGVWFTYHISTLKGASVDGSDPSERPQQAPAEKLKSATNLIGDLHVQKGIAATVFHRQPL